MKSTPSTRKLTGRPFFKKRDMDSLRHDGLTAPLAAALETIAKHLRASLHPAALRAALRGDGEVRPTRRPATTKGLALTLVVNTTRRDQDDYTLVINTTRRDKD